MWSLVGCSGNKRSKLQCTHLATLTQSAWKPFIFIIKAEADGDMRLLMFSVTLSTLLQPSNVNQYHF